MVTHHTAIAPWSCFLSGFAPQVLGGDGQRDKKRSTESYESWSLFAVILFGSLPGLEIIVSDDLPERTWAKSYQNVRLFRLSTGGDHCSNPGLGCRGYQPAADMLGSSQSWPVVS